MVLHAAGRPARPWLTVVLDDHSRVVAGYTVFLCAPTALQTALALRQAIWHKTDLAWPVYGLPDLLYSDHGSDVTGSSLAQVCADTRLRLVHSTPGVTQGRGKSERLSRDTHPRTAAHSARAHPHGTHGKSITGPRLTLPDLDGALSRYLVYDNHQRPHSETRTTPVQR